MQDKPPVTLGSALLHRRFLVLAILAAFLLVAGVLSLRPKTYEATAAIYLDTSRTAPGFDAGVASGELIQHDFIVLATSRPVLQEVCTMPTISCSADDLVAPETTLGRRVSVSVYNGTSLLAVKAKGATPTDAAALANAEAAAMIDQNKSEVTRLFKSAEDDLAKQLSLLASAIDTEQQQLQHSPAGSSAATAHAGRLASLQGQYTALFSRQQDYRQQEDRLNSLATIAQSALPPAKPEAPKPAQYLLAALVAGICVGLLAALLAERYDDRIWTAEGLASAAAIPLGLVAPRVGRPLSASERRPYSFALARLLTRPSDSRPVLVTAASARDHSDAVAAGLGAAAATAGQRVVVVQADGNGSNHRSYPTRDVAGMTTIVAPSDQGVGPAATLADVSKRYDFETADTLVLVAVPSPDTNPAAVTLGRTTKRAVLAATAGITRFRDARRTADLLRDSGVDVVAAILLSRPVRRRA